MVSFLLASFMLFGSAVLKLSEAKHVSILEEPLEKLANKTRNEAESKSDTSLIYLGISTATSVGIVILLAFIIFCIQKISGCRPKQTTDMEQSTEMAADRKLPVFEMGSEAINLSVSTLYSATTDEEIYNPDPKEEPIYAEIPQKHLGNSSGIERVPPKFSEDTSKIELDPSKDSSTIPKGSSELKPVEENPSTSVEQPTVVSKDVNDSSKHEKSDDL